ncbi:hypothetical protein JCM10207_004485 [Rhodosporidiobolus poonsookiae]
MSPSPHPVPLSSNALLLSAALHREALHCHPHGSTDEIDYLVRPLPISRHSAVNSTRSSFLSLAAVSNTSNGVPTPPKSPIEAVGQLCEQHSHDDDDSALTLPSPLSDRETDPPPPHLTPLHSPMPTPPRSLSPARSSSSPRKSRTSPSLHAPDSHSSAVCHRSLEGALNDAAQGGAGGAKEDIPETEVFGRLQVHVVEAKGLAVPEDKLAKPYVLLQYDRTDSVSREWGAPTGEAGGSDGANGPGGAGAGKKPVLRRGPRKDGAAGTTTTRRIVGGATSTSAGSSAPASAVSSTFSSARSRSPSNASPEGSPPPSAAPISSLHSISLSNAPPAYRPDATLRPVSPSPPSLPPEVIGTPQSPKWNHRATFDVVSRGRTILVCVYDKLAPQGGHPTRSHGFAGACVFEPPLIEEAEEEEMTAEAEKKSEDERGWLDVWVPLTSALDPTIGGEIRLRLKFEPLHSRPRLSITDFQLLRLIGQGSFGQVFRVRKRDTKRIYALKVIRKASVDSNQAMRQVLTERAVLEGNNDSPFLCGLKFGFQNESCFFFCLDYKAGGEMFQHLQRDGGRFEEAKVRFYVAEIVLALKFLHEKGIVYRDLKPENCLLDGGGHVVLCDFGLSKILENEPDQMTRTLCGTTSFLAPEVLLDTGYSYSADWWSLAVLLFEMMFGFSPFYAENRLDEYERILYADVKFPNKKGVGEEVKDLLRQLLTRDVPSRLGSTHGASEIQAHAFFASIDWLRLALRQVSPPFKPPTHADDDQPDYHDDGRQWRFDLDAGVWHGGGEPGRKSTGQCSLVRGFTYSQKEPRVKPWDRMARELFPDSSEEDGGAGEVKANGGTKRAAAAEAAVERFKQGEMAGAQRRSSCA